MSKVTMARTKRNDVHKERKWTITSDGNLAVKDQDNRVLDLGKVTAMSWQVQANNPREVRRIRMDIGSTGLKWGVKPKGLLCDPASWKDVESCSAVEVWHSANKWPTTPVKMHIFESKKNFVT